MTKRIPFTEKVHSILQDHLQPGDVVVDATVGNGHDTLFLSQKVGRNGQVFGFDVQNQAIESTQQRLTKTGAPQNYRLIHTCHSEMEQRIGQALHRNIKLIMFNLGYLPGSDKQVKTQSATTLKALELACAMICPTGMISIIAYPGHKEGNQEFTEIKHWTSYQLPAHMVLEIIPSSDQSNAPVLFLIRCKQIGQ